jgi:hypothetical protein
MGTKRTLTALSLTGLLAMSLVACADGTMTTAGPATPSRATVGSPPKTTAAGVSPCTLVTKRYLIERLITPDRASAYKVGDVDLRTCKPTLDTFAANAPRRPFFCSQIAWADDNPGYYLSTRSPLPLKKVLLSVGPAC